MKRKVNKMESDIQRFKQIVADSFSISEVRRKLGYKKSGGFHPYFRKVVHEHSINISHFTGQLWNKGKTLETDTRIEKTASATRWPLEDILIKNTSYRGHNQAILKKLVRAGLKKYNCEECKLDQWREKPITLQLDHVNGDNMDYRITNLKILCPNCHTQTKTFSIGMRS